MTGCFHIDADTPTGTCAVVVVDKNRTLCANLAAACKYDSKHMEENIDKVKNASLIYSTSFFITSNKEALKTLARTAHECGIPFAFNLSAVFLMQIELPTVLEVLEYADYVFANEDEADAFAKTQNIEGANRVEIAKALANFKKQNPDRPRVAIVT